jgi:hypothetical protein
MGDLGQKIRRVFLASLLVALAPPSCSTLRRMWPDAGRGTVSIPAGPTASQAGPIAAGARVSTSITRSSLPIPAGSIVEMPAAPAAQEAQPGPQISTPVAKVTLAAASTLTAETNTQTATGPTTHAPAAPPTPAELATGAGIRIFYWLAAGLAVAAVLLFYAGHGKAAIVAAAGAGGLPLLATSAAWLASHAAVAVVCVCAALVAAWYFVKNRIPDPPA